MKQTKEEEKNSTLKKTVCYTFSTFGFILFPLVVFGLLYITKFKQVFNATNNKPSTYNMTLGVLVVLNFVIGILDQVVFKKENDSRMGSTVFMGALTLFLTGLYFANRILLKNTFVIIFAMNLLSILAPRLFEQIKRLYDYCYAPEYTEEEHEEYPDIELRRKSSVLI